MLRESHGFGELHEEHSNYCTVTRLIIEDVDSIANEAIVLMVVAIRKR